MARKRSVDITVVWADGDEQTFKAEDHSTIEQKYKQLNFISDDGGAVGINLHQTRYVKIDSDVIDWNDINQT